LEYEQKAKSKKKKKKKISWRNWFFLLEIQQKTSLRSEKVESKPKTSFLLEYEQKAKKKKKK
jgi:membrane-anchored protein YejM (alkaline phosphatase superfamily)